MAKAPKPVRPKVSEKQIEATILAFLSKLKNCKVWKNQTTGIYDPTRKVYRSLRGKYSGKGSSDILACIEGRMICVEVKRPVGAVVSLDQVRFINEIKLAGGIAFVAKSVDDVRTALMEHNLIR